MTESGREREKDTHTCLRPRTRQRSERDDFTSNVVERGRSLPPRALRAVTVQWLALCVVAAPPTVRIRVRHCLLACLPPPFHVHVFKPAQAAQLLGLRAADQRVPPPRFPTRTQRTSLGTPTLFRNKGSRRSPYTRHIDRSDTLSRIFKCPWAATRTPNGIRQDRTTERIQQ